MLTNKGKYGLKAVVHLAGTPLDAPILVGDIATANDIPKKFLDTILAELRNAGIVRSKKGRGGGYTLARAPEEIMVGDVVRALDGPIAPIRCVSKNYYERCEDCAEEALCPVFGVMAQVRAAISAVLDHQSVKDVRATALRETPARPSE